MPILEENIGQLQARGPLSTTKITLGLYPATSAPERAITVVKCHLLRDIGKGTTQVRLGANPSWLLVRLMIIIGTGCFNVVQTSEERNLDYLGPFCDIPRRYFQDILAELGTTAFIFCQTAVCCDQNWRICWWQNDIQSLLWFWSLFLTLQLFFRLLNLVTKKIT